MSEINVLIIEDDPMIADDIQGFLSNQDYSVMGVAYNMEQTFELLKMKRPDLALIDINLGNNMDGLIIAERFRDEFNFPFVFLTSYSSKQVIDQAKQTQPMGYIVKPFEEADLYSTIEIALFNFSKIYKVNNFNLETINDKLMTNLTPKEFEILKDMYEGKNNKQMAEKHFVGMNTIKTHVHRVYTKLNCHSRSETMALVRSFHFEK